MINVLAFNISIASGTFVIVEQGTAQMGTLPDAGVEVWVEGGANGSGAPDENMWLMTTSGGGSPEGASETRLKGSSCN